MDIHKLRDYIKKHKISYGYLKEETGYSKVYLSYMLNGKCPLNERFLKLLLQALSKYAHASLNDLHKHLEDTPWSTYL